MTSFSAMMSFSFFNISFYHIDFELKFIDILLLLTFNIAGEVLLLRCRYWYPIKNLPSESTIETKRNKLYGPFFMDGVQLPLGLEPLWGGSLLFTTTSQKFLVLILLTSEGWITESTLESPSGFEHETLGLGIQRLNH